LEASESASDVSQLRWSDLPDDIRQALTDKLAGLWCSSGDAEAFNSLSIDKQQALLLILFRLRQKALWHLVRHITNLYGKDGVGIEFAPWPGLESTLARRKDFTAGSQSIETRPEAFTRETDQKWRCISCM